MLKSLIITLLLFGALPVQNRSNDQEQIARRLEEFTNAFNQGKSGNVSSYWSDNPEIVAPITGQVIEGRAAVSQFIQNKIDRMKGQTIHFEPQKIELPTEDSAIVEGVVQIFQNGKLIDRQARRVVLLKTDSQWKLDSISEIPVDVAPTAYDHLKGLEWLIGHWKDEDDNVTILLNGKWDKFKNFIIQSFDMKIYGVDTLEGMQIIGWDPIEQKIRSWIYDSDGGFGEGHWTQTEKGWKSTTTFTLSSGEKATSTNIYTDIGDKSYSYTSIDRKVNNTSLPNIEPTTVSKE